MALAIGAIGVHAFQQRLSFGQRIISRRSSSGAALKMSGTSNVLMPALSSTMTEGKVVSWLKAVGDFVEAGDALMVVESDKADMDVESFEEGYLAQIITDEGDSAAVGAPVAVLVESEAEISEVSSGAPAAPAASAVPADGNVDVEVIEMTMPALSSTMTEGKVMSWLVNVGDKVEAGDPVMVVESDKADMDVESFDDGYIAAILTGEGESAPVGAPVALLAKTEAEIGAVSAAGPGGGLPRSKAVETEPAGAASTTTTDKGVNEGVVAATPMAQELAKKNRLDLSTITGTGNFGRVTEDDVLVALGRPPKKATPVPPAAAAPAPAPVSSAKPEPPAARPVAKPAAPPVVPASSAPASSMQDEVVPMNNMKAAVAKNMEATLHVPAFRVSRTIITDNFDALYASLKPKGVTVSALLAKAVALCLVKHPIVNAAYDESGGIKYNKKINVAMAVALEDGLITPVLQQANEQDIYSLGRSWKDLVAKAKDNRLTPEEYNSGTFMISNLGMYGVSQFDCLLPVGVGAILAIGSSVPTVVVQKNGFMGVQKQMTVTLAADHRHIYGADSAMFLRDLAEILEDGTDQLLL